VIISTHLDRHNARVKGNIALGGDEALILRLE